MNITVSNATDTATTEEMVALYPSLALNFLLGLGLAVVWFAGVIIIPPLSRSRIENIVRAFAPKALSAKDKGRDGSKLWANFGVRALMYGLYIIFRMYATGVMISGHVGKDADGVLIDQNEFSTFSDRLAALILAAVSVLISVFFVAAASIDFTPGVGESESAVDQRRTALKWFSFGAFGVDLAFTFLVHGLGVRIFVSAFLAAVFSAGILWRTMATPTEWVF